MNSSGSYYGQAGGHLTLGQPPQTPRPIRPGQQTPFSTTRPGHSSKTAKTSNGLACTPTRPTTFVNQAKSRSDDNRDDNRSSFRPKEHVFTGRPVHITETIKSKTTVFQVTDAEIQQLLSQDLLSRQGFTEISFVDDPLLAEESLPDQNVEIHTIITDLNTKQSRSAQSGTQSQSRPQSKSLPPSPTRSPSVRRASSHRSQLVNESGTGSLPHLRHNYQHSSYFSSSPSHRGEP